MAAATDGKHGVAQVVIGVDTHQDEHVAVAIDRQGVRLGQTPCTGDHPGIWRSRAMVQEPREKLAPSGLRVPVPTVPGWHAS